MNKKTLGLCLALAAGSCFMTGCATTGSDTIVVNGSSSENLKDVGLNTQDFAYAGQEMVDSLLDPPSPQTCVLDKASQHPAIIAIGRIVNNTTLYIDTDQLMKKIRVNLNKGGKAVTDTTGGVLNTVDYTFSGKIIQPDNVREGNKTQRTYIFQLSLTDNKGLAVWEDEKQVSKITKRGGFGL
jgi:PBP1b-binding outer membrane lipoprotein LpoB